MKKTTSPRSKRRRLLGIGLAAVTVALIAVGTASFDPRGGGPQSDTVVAYKSPTCNCCSKCVRHL